MADAKWYRKQGARGVRMTQMSPVDAPALRGASCRQMQLAHQIELATADEAPVLAAMSRDLVETGLGWRWTARAIASRIRHRATNVVVARSGAGPVGFSIMAYGDDVANLLLLAVDVRCRRQGTGSALVRWLCASAANAGIETVIAEVRRGNAGARKFYAALGFRELSLLRGYYSGVEDAIRLGLEPTAVSTR